MNGSSRHHRPGRKRYAAALGRRRAAWTAAVAGALLVTGCTQTADLEPAPGETTRDGEIAVTKVEGVAVRVDAEGWPGRDEIRTHVTPLEVTIDNGGSVPVLVRYDELALIAPNGDRYAAVPPFQVEGAIEERAGTVYAPITEPGFAYDRFSVSPYYGSIYPSLHPYDGFHHAGFYHDHYIGYWETLPLPTDEMLMLALPEGVLGPGGRVSGFVYFERVDPDLDWVRFRADLVNADTGDAFGEVTMRFEVDSDYAMTDGRPVAYRDPSGTGPQTAPF